MSPEWMAAARRMLTLNEAWRPRVYRDSLGIPTVGVGFNLSRPDARAKLTAVGANFDAVLAGTEAMNANAVGQLLEDDIAAAVADLRTIFPGWDALSGNRQLALLDMRFNLGPARFRGFRQMIAAVQAGSWTEAANQMRASAWATQVKSRALKDQQWMITG